MRRKAHLALTVLGVMIGFNDRVNATCPAVPNSITNGQVADASQVMSNFNAVVNCVNGAPAGSTGYIQYNAGSGSFGGLGPMSNGQLVIGSSSGLPKVASLNAGAGISIANGNGTISISATNGGLTPTIVQSAFARSARSANATLTLKNSPTKGNILVLISSGFNTVAQSVASGFSPYASAFPATNQAISIAIRVVQTGDGASWPTQSGGDGGATFALLEVSNLTDIDLRPYAAVASGNTLMAGAGHRLSGITLGVFESDDINTLNSVSGATLLFDGTGGTSNHPSVIVTGITGITSIGVTYQSSNLSNPIFSTVVLYGS